MSDDREAFVPAKGGVIEVSNSFGLHSQMMMRGETIIPHAQYEKMMGDRVVEHLCGPWGRPPQTSTTYVIHVAAGDYDTKALQQVIRNLITNTKITIEEKRRGR